MLCTWQHQLPGRIHCVETLLWEAVNGERLLRGGVWRPLRVRGPLAGLPLKEETVISSLCCYLGEMKTQLLLEKNPRCLYLTAHVSIWTVSGGKSQL